MHKTFKYRLYPSRTQALALESQFNEARHLYNAALQERRDAWRMAGKSLNYYDQADQLKGIRAAGDCALANFSACQDVLRRVDKTFRTFFERRKQGQRAGYPRFKGRYRFDSYTFPAYGDGCKLLESGRLRLQGVGHVKVKLHRPVAGNIKTVTLKREAGHWYVCFSLECAPTPLSPSDRVVGIDVGLESFAALSDGSTVSNPRHHQRALARLRIAQRRVSRRKKGGSGRRKAVRILQRTHAGVRNQRADFHHKLSRRLVDDFGLIAVEDLNVKGLASGMLARSVNDAGWSAFIAKLTYKAEEAGRVLIKVNPRGTSQVCSACGARVAKPLSERLHVCPACGVILHRDLNAALNILRLGLSLVGETWPNRACVPTEAVCFS